jgi:hypothetical protein
MSLTAQRTERTLASQLAHDRLRRRARRIEQVLVVLRDRRDSSTLHGPRPAALDQAIAGFGQELASIQKRLRRLS